MTQLVGCIATFMLQHRATAIICWILCTAKQADDKAKQQLNISSLCSSHLLATSYACAKSCCSEVTYRMLLQGMLRRTCQPPCLEKGDVAGAPHAVHAAPAARPSRFPGHRGHHPLPPNIALAADQAAHRAIPQLPGVLDLCRRCAVVFPEPSELDSPLS